MRFKKNKNEEYDDTQIRAKGERKKYQKKREGKRGGGGGNTIKSNKGVASEWYGDHDRPVMVVY